MKKIATLLLSLLFALHAMLLTGCAIRPTESATLYDLGPLHTKQSGTLPALPPLSVADIQVPAWLDSTMFYFRLNYANDQQPRPYAHARWIEPPGQLLVQQLKSRIAQAGGIVLPASDGAINIPVLRIEADDFTQYFEAPGRSTARVGLRAAVYRGRVLVAQKSLSHEAPAPSADAAGGAKALAAASDAAISDLIMWLGTLNLK
ncbi:MAG TPA: ABC-type transport auxiliary lipoprotein family protein [Noviherbaspirillum sp.]|uniref:ABC-type transport auxiliary lipoprotein family protein n=1 Tax=Noviherbaspirillum sp. TaxID=1926288 RepID=UPI002B4A8297|nr:ABC-type transport auxiliary lipoprotein family protein [Noviherbaspirillum sp.]HJV87194.1 ABC-type transport auxiliary lipoprotein family protein [Noviherbaspirillum sp.]